MKRGRVMTNAKTLPPEVADVALLGIEAVCAAHGMSASWVHEEVRKGRAPQPLRFGQRCARWQASAVRAWLIERSEQAQRNAAATAELVTRRAKTASDAAKVKRQPLEAVPA